MTPRVAGRGGAPSTRCATRTRSQPIGEAQAAEPTWVAAESAGGRGLTYSVGRALPADTRLVLTITDDSGKQIRRMDVSKETGLRRVVWNLRGDPPPQAANQAGRGGAGGAGAGGGRWRPRRLWRRRARSPHPDGTRVTLGKMTGDQVTAIGRPQTFRVLALPARNY